MLNYAAAPVQTDATGAASSVNAGLQIAFIAEGQVVANSPGTDAAGMLALRDRLKRQPATPLSPDGDTHQVDGNDFLFHSPAHPTTSELSIVGTGTHLAPDVIVDIWNGFGRSLATAWRVAG